MLICGIEIEKKGVKPGAEYGVGKYSVEFSLLWKRTGDIWKILYIHMSQPMKVRCRSLVEKPVNTPEEVEKDLWLNPGELLYVEAKNIRCELHFREHLVTVQKSLSECEKKLPDYFLRIHRSYLVNTEHILRMERYCVYLRGGEVLPVPEKKYTQIRRKVLAYLD